MTGRDEIFSSCLAKVPPGPVAVKRSRRPRGGCRREGPDAGPDPAFAAAPFGR